jgi:hypothetical protein
VGSNPAVYWIDVSNLQAITLKKIEDKGSKWGIPKKKKKKGKRKKLYLILI